MVGHEGGGGELDKESAGRTGATGLDIDFLRVRSYRSRWPPSGVCTGFPSIARTGLPTWIDVALHATADTSLPFRNTD